MVLRLSKVVEDSDRVHLASSSQKEMVHTQESKQKVPYYSNSHDFVDKLQASVYRRAAERLSHSPFCQDWLKSRRTEKIKAKCGGNKPAIFPVKTQQIQFHLEHTAQLGLYLVWFLSS